MRQARPYASVAPLAALCCALVQLSGTGCDSAPSQAPVEAHHAALADPSAVPTAAPAAAKLPDKAAAGTVAEGSLKTATFELRAVAKGDYRAGLKNSFSVELEGRGGYHVNAEYPIRLRLEGPTAVSFDKAELKKEDAATFSEDGARFDVPVALASAGEHRVLAHLDFAVCTEANCVPERRSVSIRLAVK